MVIITINKKSGEKLKKLFFNTYKFSNFEVFFMLWRGLCPYEYMDDWEKFNKTSLTEKEDFYRTPDMEDITDADYTHTIKVSLQFVKI